MVSQIDEAPHMAATETTLLARSRRLEVGIGRASGLGELNMAGQAKWEPAVAAALVADTGGVAKGAMLSDGSVRGMR